MSTQNKTRVAGAFILAIVFCLVVFGGTADMSYDMDYFHGGDVHANIMPNHDSSMA